MPNYVTASRSNSILDQQSHLRAQRIHQGGGLPIRLRSSLYSCFETTPSIQLSNKYAWQRYFPGGVVLPPHSLSRLQYVAIFLETKYFTQGRFYQLISWGLNHSAFCLPNFLPNCSVLARDAQFVSRTEKNVMFFSSGTQNHASGSQTEHIISNVPNVSNCKFHVLSQNDTLTKLKGNNKCCNTPKNEACQYFNKLKLHFYFYIIIYNILC